jgi:hypothetical protein
MQSLCDPNSVRSNDMRPKDELPHSPTWGPPLLVIVSSLAAIMISAVAIATRNQHYVFRVGTCNPHTHTCRLSELTWTSDARSPYTAQRPQATLAASATAVPAWTLSLLGGSTTSRPARTTWRGGAAYITDTAAAGGSALDALLGTTRTTQLPPNVTVE